MQDREEWEDEHRRDGTPSQTWRYAAAVAKSGCEPRLAVVEDSKGRLLLPFIERTWRGHIDIATLPGLSGACFTGSASIWQLWRDFARAQGWVAGYVLLASKALEVTETFNGELVKHDTVFRLNPQNWSASQCSAIIRRKIAAALRSGAKIVEDREILSRALPRLYSNLMQRFGGGARFSEATLQQWCSDPGNLLIGAGFGNEVELVHLIHTAGMQAELHIVGASGDGRPLSSLLFQAEIHALKSLGVRDYNLGGAGNDGGGLYTFKSWLAADPAPLHALHQVYDTARYADLCSVAGVSMATDWFPAYRAEPLTAPTV
jgi:hypothetical protein